MKIWTPLAVIVALGLGAWAYKRGNTHEVTYVVHRATGSQSITISYLQKPVFGSPIFPNATKVHIPVSSLPWSKTVNLPTGATAWLQIENDSGGRGKFEKSIIIDKGEVLSKSITPAPHTSHVRIVGYS